MKKPEIPDNEEHRLDALSAYEVMDTGPEPAFDALTQLAAHIAQVPIALVSLVDADRQWFKSRYGLDAPETPRDVSFCGHVVASERELIVNDSHVDERFADNPLVTGGPRVRFYAGMPLTTAEGFVLGTLCVIDNVAREISEEQQRMLDLLSQQVVDQLELRRRNRQIARAYDQAQRLAAVVESTDDAIFTESNEGRIESWNGGAARLFGYSAEDALGQPSAILDVAGAPVAIVPVESAPTNPDLHRYDTLKRAKDGRSVEVSITTSPLLDPRGKVVGSSKILRDISYRNHLTRMKSEFVSTVSHELRTPLTSIRGSLGLVAGGITGAIPAEAAEYVGIALANSERLVRLINDILDIEKMDSGQMDFRFESLPLSASMEDARAANAAFAQSHDVSLQLDQEGDDVEVLVDSDRLAQVFANLISNAAKFSPKGGTVVVSSKAAGRSVRVEVSDRGEGIPDKFRDRIFGRFAQADASTTRQKGGTGLGLSISKSIVERMHGSIGFESTVGEGTTFFFELPCLPLVQETGDQGARLLVCEDDPDAARLMEELFTRSGYSVDVAPTLERARRLLAAHHYAAITLDLVLADGPGTDLIDDLRANPATRLTPIVVVSGSKTPLDQVAVHVADVLIKPYEEARLVAAVGAAIDDARENSTILLYVEDDMDLQRVVTRTLPSEWVIMTVGSVTAARKALSEQPFDVVLLDLSLPDGSADTLLPHVGEARVVIFSASEVSQEIGARVSSALVKSHANPQDVRNAIEALLDGASSGVTK